jgi:hypothetical protein
MDNELSNRKTQDGFSYSFVINLMMGPSRRKARNETRMALNANNI